MDTNIVSLKNRKEIAEGTMAFHFEKSARLQFKAGQAIDVTLVSPAETDAQGNTGAFSILRPPFGEDLAIAPECATWHSNDS